MTLIELFKAFNLASFSRSDKPISLPSLKGPSETFLAVKGLYVLTFLTSTDTDLFLPWEKGWRAVPLTPNVFFNSSLGEEKPNV